MINFRGFDHPRKFFNDENFPDYGSKTHGSYVWKLHVSTYVLHAVICFPRDDIGLLTYHELKISSCKVFFK